MTKCENRGSLKEGYYNVLYPDSLLDLKFREDLCVVLLVLSLVCRKEETRRPQEGRNGIESRSRFRTTKYSLRQSLITASSANTWRKKVQ
jgi:hypothetical protein